MNLFCFCLHCVHGQYILDVLRKILFLRQWSLYQRLPQAIIILILATILTEPSYGLNSTTTVLLV